MTCPCDTLIHPPPLRIDAGLSRLPRQGARFPEFRRAMLAELGRHDALQDWRARNEDDLGVMLLEMWAYVCDVLSFYDEVIAHEVYVRTARRRPSLRKVVALLGHIPRPAVAASVYLAAIAEGRKPVRLPAGTAFRSEAFDGEPPQVFELEQEAIIHPQNNRWRIGAQRPGTLGGSTKDSLLLEPTSVDLEPGDPILIRPGESDANTHVNVVSKVEPYQGQDGHSYVKVTFEDNLTLGRATELETLRLSRPTQTAGLWISPFSEDGYFRKVLQAGNVDELFKIGTVPFAQSSFETPLILDALYKQIHPGNFVLVSKARDYRWGRVKTARPEHVPITEGTPTTITQDDKEFTVNPPPTKMPVTRLTLDGPVPDSWKNDGSVTVHYGFVDAGKVTVELQTSLTGKDPVSLASSPGGGRLELPPEEARPARLLLQDHNEHGHLVEGDFEFISGGLNLGKHAFEPPLATPTDVFGNVLRAFRGETVAREVLGSGDASVAEQAFKLKKKPLTYLPAPTADGESDVAPVLTVWVDGIRWRRVRSFFGTRPNDRGYIVRQNDEGESVVTFRGRLPTGTDNVVARYRFGAGAATPPAGAIHQLAKPVKGVTSVDNPVAAFGGADAEGPKELRTAAPRSALLLGRAVSLADFEARAATEPGVRAVHVEWRWHEQRQRPVVQVWFIGDEGIEGNVHEALRGIADPTVSLDVERARPRPLRLVLEIEVDPGYVKDQVLQAVCHTLTDPDSGILAPENIGIDQPLFRSRIFEQALSVAGAVAVPALDYDMDPFKGSAPFTPIAIEPCDSTDRTGGRYFDVEGGRLELNAREEDSG